MKQLIFNGEIFEAEKIVKDDLNIIGYDLSNNEVFMFSGISDFSQFQLKDKNENILEFAPPPPTSEQRISAMEEVLKMLI